ncbi:MAG: cyclic nucleotide-binding domain-containing protein [Burkholderiaceae bacterium]
MLSQTAFFRELTPSQIARIAALSRIQNCSEGQQIYRIGDPARAVYVLVKGHVRMAIAFGGRNASAGDILRRGEVFGWAALTPRCNLRIATASCLTPCVFLAIDGNSLAELMEQDHTLGYVVMKQLTQLITGTLTAFAGG